MDSALTAAKEKQTAMAAELRAERSAFATGQVQERGKLVERHAGENRQMQDAVRARQEMDRAAEVSARREAARTFGNERQQQQEREQGREIGRDISPR